jgi:hypothetical protein
MTTKLSVPYYDHGEVLYRDYEVADDLASEDAKALFAATELAMLYHLEYYLEAIARFEVDLRKKFPGEGWK